MPKTKHRPAPTPLPILPNPQDFFCQGDLTIINTPVPVFVIDGVSLSELVRFHFKPQNGPEGFRLGRCQVFIVPVKE